MEVYFQTEGQGTHHKMVSLQPMPGFSPLFNGAHSMSSPKLIGTPLKRLNKDEMNGIERLHIQLNYSWFNSFVGKISGKYNGRERF